MRLKRDLQNDKNITETIWTFINYNLYRSNRCWTFFSTDDRPKLHEIDAKVDELSTWLEPHHLETYS